MLSKSERLTSSDFKANNRRRIIRGELCDISYYPTEETSSRFSVIVSKKTLKKAVERNRVKRKVYHILKNTRPQKSYGICIYPKAKSLITESSVIYSEIKKLFATL